PYIRLEQVAIEGIDKKTGEELIQACDLHSGLSLIALNLYDLKQKIEKHPWIRSASLERRFPNTLILKAEKETPWALVVTDRIYFMNRHGEIFKEAYKSENLDFPVIRAFQKIQRKRRNRWKRPHIS
ncbi:MAG TPA: FtsQ-type POTRA domain-containing protein, partial [Desulfobacteraceae bacterium]|nr:FtsQ-type POTRA domain-containing protein [Desulfobacteraceae bacterium]